MTTPYPQRMSPPPACPHLRRRQGDCRVDNKFKKAKDVTLGEDRVIVELITNLRRQKMCYACHLPRNAKGVGNTTSFPRDKYCAYLPSYGLIRKLHMTSRKCSNGKDQVLGRITVASNFSTKLLGVVLNP